MVGILGPLPGGREGLKELILHVTDPSTLWAILKTEDDVGDYARKR